MRRLGDDAWKTQVEVHPSKAVNGPDSPEIQPTPSFSEYSEFTDEKRRTNDSRVLEIRLRAHKPALRQTRAVGVAGVAEFTLVGVHLAIVGEVPGADFEREMR